MNEKWGNQSHKLTTLTHAPGQTVRDTTDK